MSDNPFSEPDDSDRTVIRPIPGGKRPATPPPAQPSPFDSPFGGAPAAAAPGYSAPAAALPADAPETISMGGAPLIAAAGPLLQLSLIHI